MCFWMTNRQRVCREGTGREQAGAELGKECGGHRPQGSPVAPAFVAAVVSSAVAGAGSGQSWCQAGLGA